MKTLELFNLPDHFSLANRDQENALTLSSPALEAMQDFRHQLPLTIEPGTSLEEARAIFHRAHVKLKLVINNTGEILGLLTLADISKYKEMKMQADGHDRQLLTVNDMMTPVSQLKAVDYQSLEHATVGRLLNTLQYVGLQYCLVTNEQRDQLIGIISADDVAARVHAPISIRKAPSFADLFAELHVEG